MAAASCWWRAASAISNWRRSFTAAAAFFTWSTVISPGMAAASRSQQHVTQGQAGALVILLFGSGIGRALGGEQGAAGEGLDADEAHVVFVAPSRDGSKCG